MADRLGHPMTPPTPYPIAYRDLQAQALDQTKKGGDPLVAVTLGLLTLAAAVRDLDTNEIATAIDGLGTSVEAAAL